jgi:hypothetical protein
MGSRSRNHVHVGVQSKNRSEGASQHSESSESGGSRLHGEIESQFFGALRKFRSGVGYLARHDLVELALQWSEGTGGVPGVCPPLVPSLLWSHLCTQIELAWDRGWQPADVPRVAVRDFSAKHAELVVDVIADHAESYRSRQRTLPSWMDQLDAIAAVVWWDPGTDHLLSFARARELDLEDLLSTGLELLVMIHHLPKIPLLDPPPSKWDTSAALDAALNWRKRERGRELRHLERVRALLAKAESTTFEEEADAFTDKAQELMTRYSIDAALLALHTAGKLTGPQPRGIRIGIDNPYSRAKVMLLSEIAGASGCKVVWSQPFGFATLFGFEGEMKSVEVLYTSLLLQARKVMMRAGKTDRCARSRSFRQSFLVGFAFRIGQRLEESAGAVISDISEEHGGVLVPLMAERSRMVDECEKDAYPNCSQGEISITDWSGWASGKDAADLAEIARGPLLDRKAEQNAEAATGER